MTRKPARERVHPMQRYLDQSHDYGGKADATAHVYTPCGETVPMVRMRYADGRAYVLAWIGAELAESPDEYEGDGPPDDYGLPDDWPKPRWHKL
jgi:hypothetical protein